MSSDIMDTPIQSILFNHSFKTGKVWKIVQYVADFPDVFFSIGYRWNTNSYAGLKENIKKGIYNVYELDKPLVGKIKGTMVTAYTDEGIALNKLLSSYDMVDGNLRLALLECDATYTTIFARMNNTNTYERQKIALFWQFLRQNPTIAGMPIRKILDHFLIIANQQLQSKLADKDIKEYIEDVGVECAFRETSFYTFLLDLCDDSNALPKNQFVWCEDITPCRVVQRLAGHYPERTNFKLQEFDEVFSEELKNNSTVNPLATLVTSPIEVPLSSVSKNILDINDIWKGASLKKKTIK